MLTGYWRAVSVSVDLTHDHLCFPGVTMPRNDTSRTPALGGKSREDQTQAPRLGGDAALTHVIAALQDADIAVRERALEALEEIGSEQALDLLIQSSRDQHVSVRRRAFTALGRLQGAAVAAALRAGLTDPDDAIRQSAVTAAASHRDRQDIPTLLNILYYDERRDLRSQAAMALAEIGDPLLAPDLITATMNILFGSKRGRPLRRLYEQHPQHTADVMVSTLLNHDAQREWSPFLRLFVTVKAVEAVPALIAAMLDARQDMVNRRRAIYALGAMRHASAAPALLQAAQNPDLPPVLRVHAARQAGKLKSPEVAPVLIALLLDGGPIAVAAMVGLQSNRDPAAVPVLIDLLEHDDWKIRRRTLNILRARKVREAIPGMIGGLSDVRLEVREMAVKALGHLHQPETLPALMGALRSDKSARVRAVTTQALMKFSSEESLRALAGALGDSSDDVRRGAAVALHRLWYTDPRRVETIREMIIPYVEDPDSTTRYYLNAIVRGR
jgi:HEAT repeat protein